MRAAAEFVSESDPPSGQQPAKPEARSLPANFHEISLGAELVATVTADIIDQAFADLV